MVFCSSDILDVLMDEGSFEEVVPDSGCVKSESR